MSIRAMVIVVALASVALVSCEDDRMALDAASPTDSGLAVTPCPADPPAEGAGCTGFAQCTYVRCATDGVTTATCTTGAYRVVTTACESFSCFAETCGPGQLCRDMSGGAAIGTCTDNPCGDGPIDCSCLDSICGGTGGCMVTGPQMFRCEPGCGMCP